MMTAAVVVIINFGGCGMYKNHDLEILIFEEVNCYVMEWASDGEEGEDQYSIQPGREAI